MPLDKRSIVSSFLALAVAVTLLLIAASARADEPAGTTTTPLYPGDNLVGWIAEEAPVADLFAAVPEIETAWAWNALERRWLVASPLVPAALHTLRTLTPGMGLRVHIDADAPVQWTRSAVPARGLVELRPGLNLVAWSGPDESAIEYLARGIGTSFAGSHAWDAANTQRISYDAEASETTADFPTTNRGDALWINASRSVNWLQPTGVLPWIEFPDGASQSFKNTVRRDLARVLEFFSTAHGIEADHSSTKVTIREGSAEPGGWAGSATFHGGIHYLNAFEGQWRQRGHASGQPSGLQVLAHEYFHVLQSQLSVPTTGLRIAPLWLVEGTAVWMQFGPEAEANYRVEGSQSLYRRHALRSAKSAPPLPDIIVGEFDGTEYTLGFLASDRLAQDSGADAIVEFWRSFAPTPIGPHGRWTSAQSWRDAFQAAFGKTTEDFYAEFHSWRSERGLSPAQRPVDETVRIQGTITGPDGSPLIGVIVGALPKRRSEMRPTTEPATTTSSDGTFSLAVSMEERYTLAVPLSPDCEVSPDLRGGVTTNVGSDWYTITVGDSDVNGIDMSIPADLCAWRIRGRVVDSSGNGLGRVSVNSSGGYALNTDDDGSFAMTMKQNGKFRLHIQLDDGCSFWYAEDHGITASVLNAARITIDGGDAAPVRIEVPDTVCTWQIRGRVVNPSGAGMADVRVSAGDWTTAVTTDANGRFALNVPTDGEYRIGLEVRSAPLCIRYYAEGGLARWREAASVLRVDGGHVDGVRIVVPPQTCN